MEKFNEFLVSRGFYVKDSLGNILWNIESTDIDLFNVMVEFSRLTTIASISIEEGYNGTNVDKLISVMYDMGWDGVSVDDDGKQHTDVSFVEWLADVSLYSNMKVQ